MASSIDPSAANSLIKEFQDQNASASGPALKTADGQNLNGFFLDRQTLETMLSKPDTVGVSVYLAKHPDFTGQASNTLSLVMTGAKPNTDADPSTPYVSNGVVMHDVPTCPPFCAKV